MPTTIAAARRNMVTARGLGMHGVHYESAARTVQRLDALVGRR